MYQKERLDNIMSILKEYNYVTVKYLVSRLHYSTATINRDLNLLENQKMLKRTYGGVELNKSRSVPLAFRYHKMRPAKKLIAKKAAGFVKNGDTIFMDGSTSVEYIGQYITGKKNLTVITNNIALASYLSNFNIKIICLGGKMVEVPSMLCSSETVENAMKYKADKVFFSIGSLTSDGFIVQGELYYFLHKTMINNSNDVFLLVDHDKIDRPGEKILFDLGCVDYLITDYRFSDETKAAYPNTNFIEVTIPEQELYMETNI